MGSSSTLQTWDLAYFAIAFAAGACGLAVFLSIAGGVKSRWLPAILAAAGLVVSVIAASVAVPGENTVVQTWWKLLAGGRLHLALVSAGGLCGALAGSAISAESRWGRRALGWMLYSGAVMSLLAIVLRENIGRVLEIPTASGAQGTLIQRSVVPGFRLEEIATLDGMGPTCIAVDGSGRIYVAGYSGISYQNGEVVRLEPGSDPGRFRVRRVATHLNRPHGLAVHGSDLYVSRAGQYTKAVNGRLVDESTGAVTRLRDLDGDGEFDHYTDIVTGLPGAQLPDGLHQNNGIVFDNEDRLLIAVGSPSDHGPSPHPYAGTILRCRPDGSELEVFARGLRNPFDLCFGPQAELFCTDNDPNRSNDGDELNHVVFGAHLGFPFATAPATVVEGTTPPIMHLTSAQGLAFAPPGSLPAGYDNCLYAASYADGHLNRIRLESKGDSFAAQVDFFAHIPSVVDVAITPGGEILACSHHDRKIYRIVKE